MLYFTDLTLTTNRKANPMLLNILNQVNWVDIFVLILGVRICYVAVKSGFPVELFKFIGTIAAIYLSLHYYVLLTAYIKEWLPLEGRLPQDFLQFIVFLALAAAGYYSFMVLRSIFYRFLKMEAVSTLNKWGSLILGVARAVFLASLIMFTFVISTVSYFNNSVKSSYTGKHLFMVAPNTYSWLWNSVTSKFAFGEKYNDTITVISEEFLTK
jgi:uncharacterized membrane protein required for colicin V production